MKKLINKIVITVGTLLALAIPAYAIDLDSAKAQGLVGEMSNGYLGAVKPSSEVNKLVNDINSKRKSAYQQIASKTNTSLANVEKLGGQKAINKTPRGQFVNTGGGWKQK